MPAQPAVRPTSADRIRAARWFAEHGFGVFSCWSATAVGVCRCPKGTLCDSPGKHPITANGFQDATTDPERIGTMLSAASEPNYGLVCPDGVFALDVDGDGTGQLAELEARLGALPPTLRTETANGQHVFLRWPEGHPKPLRKMFGFVTRWGTGRHAGYVIGPRSVHPSGAVYSPTGVAEIATLPEVWARAVADSSATLTVTGRVPVEQVHEGGRHDWLRDRARYYRGLLDDPAVLRAAILAENDRLAAPKTADDVERAIGEVFEKFPKDEVVTDPDTGQARRVPDEELGLLPAPAIGAFPAAPAPVAFEGLLGECTFDLAGGTDASLVGLLGSLIAFCGAMVPGQAYFHRLHTSSPYIALVGESSIGRKGTAMNRAQDAVADALAVVSVNRVVLDGLNSGEGLISTLQYRQSTFPQEPTVGLVFEEEYASLLASRGREGSTLDPKMRAAFDGGPLSNRKAAGTQTVSPPYWLPALIGITPAELRVRLEAGAMQSGSANRWLYLPVVRRDLIPTNEAPRFSDAARDRLQDARRRAMTTTPTLTTDRAVVTALAEYSDYLPGVSVGPARDLTKRLAVIAFRIALIHALVEGAHLVAMVHLERALALTEYARSGIGWVFGQTIGNRDADLLYRHLVAHGSLRQNAITREIIRDPIRRQDAIDELIRLGYAAVSTVHTTGGRPRAELVLDPKKGTFRPFNPLFAISAPTNAKNRDGMDESAQSPGRNSVGALDETRTKLDETTVHDHQTGEVENVTEAVWIRSPCAVDVFHAHSNYRRNTPNGWVCDACDSPEETT